METGELNIRGVATTFNTLAVSGGLSVNSDLSITTVKATQWRTALNVPSVSDIYIYNTYIALSGHPGPNNDSVDTAGIGYKFNTGSRWSEAPDSDEYLCVSGGVGSAVWRKVAGYPVPLTAISGNVTIDARLTGNKVWFLLNLNSINSNVTLLTPTNGYDGQTVQLKVRQHATSAKTVSISGNFRINQIALDVSSTLNSTTYLGLVCDISAGVSYYDLISQIYTA